MGTCRRRSSKSPKYENHCRGYRLQHNPNARFPLLFDFFKFGQPPTCRDIRIFARTACTSQNTIEIYAWGYWNLWWILEWRLLGWRSGRVSGGFLEWDRGWIMDSILSHFEDCQIHYNPTTKPRPFKRVWDTTWANMPWAKLPWSKTAWSFPFDFPLTFQWFPDTSHMIF